MDISNNRVSEELKNSTAIKVMRDMLIDYSEDQQIPFEDSALSFAKSETYKALFDFATEIWKEGPDYLRWLYDEELNRQNN